MSRSQGWQDKMGRGEIKNTSSQGEVEGEARLSRRKGDWRNDEFVDRGGGESQTHWLRPTAGGNGVACWCKPGDVLTRAVAGFRDAPTKTHQGSRKK